MIVNLHGGWASGYDVDRAFGSATASGPYPFDHLHVVVWSRLKVDAAVRLLCYANQSVHRGVGVSLDFSRAQDTMGYITRMDFFDRLDARVEVLPERPPRNAARAHRGGNGRLVEIGAISVQGCEQGLPKRLIAALERACGGRDDYRALREAAWTTVSELIGNVVDHSGTKLDGFAALQVYQGGNHLTVAVSDSGLGILRTLRPALALEAPDLVGASDAEVLRATVQRGISSAGEPGRGHGLKDSAAKAMQFGTSLEIRTERQIVVLEPAAQAYEPARGLLDDSLPHLAGTHMTFTFRLNS